MAEEIYQMIRKLSIFSALSDEEIMKMLDRMEVHRNVYLPDTVLAHKNAPCDTLYLVKSGEVALEYTTFSNNIYIASVYKKDSIIGPEALFSTPGTWPLTLMTLSNAEILTLSAEPFRHLSHQSCTLNESICCSILQEYIDRKNRDYFKKICRSAVGTRTKILVFCDLMQDKTGSNVFRVKLSRDEMAAFLGIGRSSLFRELKKLMEEDVLRLKGDRMVEVNQEKFYTLKLL